MNEPIGTSKLDPATLAFRMTAIQGGSRGERMPCFRARLRWLRARRPPLEWRRRAQAWSGSTLSFDDRRPDGTEGGAGTRRPDFGSRG
jgi:hypothetical protein